MKKEYMTGILFEGWLRNMYVLGRKREDNVGFYNRKKEYSERMEVYWRQKSKKRRRWSYFMGSIIGQDQINKWSKIKIWITKCQIHINQYITCTVESLVYYKNWYKSIEELRNIKKLAHW